MVRQELVLRCTRVERWIISRLSYYGTYLLIPYESVITSEKKQLIIHVCYDEYKEGELWRTVYSSIDFRNIMLSADGRLELDYDKRGTGFVDNLDSYIEKLKNEYHVHIVDEATPHKVNQKSYAKSFIIFA